MNGISFWEKDAAKISAIVESFDRVLDNSYIWVTNLKEHKSWCSEKTKEYFGLTSSGDCLASLGTHGSVSH